MRLIVFPHAGGGIVAYHRWPQSLPETVELCGVQLPGRETRFSESPVRDIADITRFVTEAIEQLDDVPTLLFGHSMGAWVAFEVASQLQRGQRGPAALIVSGRTAPHLASRTPRIAHLRGSEIVRRASDLFGGIPDEMLREPALIDLMARVLEADLSALEGYRYTGDEPLRCPLVALAGDADPWVTDDELDAWRERTTGSFHAERLPGGHFYFRDGNSLLRLLDLLNRQCAAMLDAHARLAKR